MASKFGGIEVEKTEGMSKFGGVPMQEQQQVQQHSQVQPDQEQQPATGGITPEVIQAYRSGTFTPEKQQAFEELQRRGRIPSTPELDKFLQGLPAQTQGFQEKPVSERPFSVAAGKPEELYDIQGGEQGMPTAEAAMTLGSGIVAEPIAGLAGIAGAVLPGESGQGAEFVGKTREALTYKPVSEEAYQKLETVGKVVEPVAKAMKSLEEGLGDTAYNVTGSPTIAAASTTIPTIVSEVLGVAAGKAATSSLRKIKNARRSGKIASEIKSAAPEADQIKAVARELYKEIDESGVVVKKDAYSTLADEINTETKRAGIDPDITPKASKAVQRIDEMKGEPVTVTELDTLRKVAQNAAKSIDAADAMLGKKIINKIDDFLDTAGPKKLDIPNIKEAPDITKNYRVARDLWGRAKKSELIQEAFTKADLQASGIENGIRIQFRSILNNKKSRKFFNKDEIVAMKKVVQGGKVENFAKLVGRLGFGEGSSTNILGASIGAGAGATIFGPAGAVAIPIIGQVSRKLAQRMTMKGAKFADQVIRAGKNADKIIEAYIKNTPKAARSPEELAQLLIRTDIDLSAITKNSFNDAAVKAATNYRDIIATTAATETAIRTAVNEQETE